MVSVVSTIDWSLLTNCLDPKVLGVLLFVAVFCLLVHRMTTPRRRRIPRIARQYSVRRAIQGDASLVVIE